MIVILPCACAAGTLLAQVEFSWRVMKGRNNHRYSVPYLAIAWFVILFLLSYWFRAVEVTACQLPGTIHQQTIET